ncbi:PAS domain S-box protein [Rubrobacter radiotolerans]|uniref:histidine kinase n=1 Tax=Rubrobacter radiotolerans TaxID=42256 RepID=A0AB35T2T1_RUBRA|nr:PAS domain S-box protein [Rubrobacter radiotolerans]MDX5893638.1 PAS domain S-box protein [Rubrobacter radiotolerans]SMC04168.1 PAS domain S-box-containing protein [Rubrobacter radiotolerans DSM 5868]
MSGPDGRSEGVRFEAGSDDLRSRLADLEAAERVAGLGRWKRDLASEETRFSPVCREHFGRFGDEREEPFGYGDLLQAVHPEDRERVRKTFERTVREGATYKVEHRVVWPDGTLRHLLSQGEVLRGDTGEARALIGTTLDVTEQKQETHSQHSGERFRAVIEATEQTVFRVSADWESILQLRGEEAILGATIEREGDWLMRYIHPDDRRRVAETIGAAVNSGSAFELEVRVLRADGTVGWAHVRTVPMRDEAGEVYEWFGAASDITERKRAEEALRESDEQYRTLFESIDEGFCTIEVLFDEAGEPFDYRFLEMNPAFERQTGIENGAGRTMREVAPEHEEFWFEVYGRIAETSEAVRFEHEAAALDPPRYYDVFAFRIGEPEENRVAIIFNDILTRKQAEEALRISEERLRLFVTATSDMVYRMSPDWSEMYTLEGKNSLADTTAPNPAWFDEYIPDSDRELVQAAISEAISDKKTFELEHRVIRADGGVGWVFSRAIPLLDERGEIVEWFGAGSDITERKQAEAALHEAQQSLEVALEAAELGVWDVDLTSGAARTNVRHNQSFGYSEAVTTWGPEVAREHMLPEDHQVFADAYNRALTSGTLDMTVRVRWPDGSVHWISDRGRVFYDSSGQPVRMSGVTLDITERKRAEANLAFLNEISQDLARLTNIDETMNVLGEKIGRFFAVKQCVFAEHADELEASTVAYGWHVEDARDLNGIYRTRDFLSDELIASLSSGEPFPVSDTQSDTSVNADSFKTLGIRSFITAPLLRDGEWRFQISINDDKPREWRDDEIELFREVCERVFPRIERARAEEALAASEEKYRTLFDSIDEGFIEMEMLMDDAGRVVDWRWIDFNPAFERMSGLKGVKGRLFSEIVPDPEPEWAERYGHVVATGEALRFEMPVSGLDSWFDIFVSRIGGEGSRRVAVVFNNITERKRREANLAFLAEVAQDLAALTNIDETMSVLGAKIGAHLNVARCMFAELDEAEDRATVLSDWHRSQFSSAVGSVPISQFVDEEFRRRCRAGETIVIRDVHRTSLVDTEQVENVFQIGSMIVVPVSRGGQWLLLLGIYHDEPRDWRADEIELAEQLAVRIWSRLERARDEEALAASEEKYRTLFDSIDEGVGTIELIFDEDERVVDYVYLEQNPSFERLTGLSSDVVGRPISEIVPDLEAFWFETFERVARTGEPERFERQVAALGKWFEVYVSRVGGPDSRELVYVYNDITERKRQEQRQQYLLKLGDALRTMASPTDIESVVTRLALEHFAADRCYYCTIEDGNAIARKDAVRGDLPSVAGVYPLHDFAIFRNAIEAGNPYAVPDVHTTDKLDEGLRQICLQLGIVSNIIVPVIKHGAAVGLFCLVQSTPREWTQTETDLAAETAERTWSAIERARAEEALAASEEKYRTLFDSLDEGVVTIELIFDENGRVVDHVLLESNPALTRQTGYSQDVIGRRVSEINPNLEPFWHETFERVALSGESERFEYFVSELGQWLDVFASRVGGEGSRTLVCVYDDITERKRREANLAFLAGVSQDLARLREIEETMDALGEKIGEYFSASLCGFSVIDEAAGTFTNPYVWHRTGVPNIVGEFRIDDYHGEELRRACRAGETYVVRNVNAAGAPATNLTTLGVGAFVTVPLVRGGEWRFNLTIADTGPRDWREDEIELMRELASRIWTRLERARAEEELRESEERLRRTLEAARMGSWSLDLRTNETSRSPRHDQIFGYEEPLPEWSYATFLEHVHPDDRPLVAGKFEHSRKSGEEWKFECRILRADGELRWISAIGDFTCDTSEEPSRMFVLVTDITERKRSEEALRESEEQLRLVTDAVPALISYVDREVRYRFINRAYSEWYKRPPEEILGRRMSEIAGPFYEEIRPQVEAALAGQTVQFESVVSPEHARLLGWGESRLYLEASFIPRFSRDSGAVEGFYVLVLDITERRRTEEALRESESRFREFAENSQDVMWILDARSRQLEYVSPAFEEVWGESRDRILNDLGRWAELVHPEDHERAQEGISRTLTGEVFANEYRIVRQSDGEVRWIVDTGFPIFGDSGELTRIGGLARDVTEQRRSEVALRKSESRLATIFSRAAAGLSELSVSGRFERVNDGLCDLLGRSREELLSLRITDVTHPDDLAASSRTFKRLLETGGQTSLDKRYVRPDGSVVWVNSALTLLEDEEGHPRSVLAVTVDLTERHRAEAALRESEEWLHLAQQAAGAGTWEWDLRTGAIQWSPEHKALFGFDPEEPVTREKWWSGVPPEDVALLDAAWQRCAAGKERVELEYRLVSKDGRTRWMNARGRTVFDDSGRAERVIGITVEFTERKRAERERERLRLQEWTIRAEVAERERISRELHDRTAHDLGVLHQSLELYRVLRGTSPERADLRLETARQMARLSLDSIRNLAVELRGSEAEHSLQKTLSELLDALAGGSVPGDGPATDKRPEFEFRFRGDEGSIPGPIKLQMYLILREATLNALRHSGCRRIRVEVSVSNRELLGSVRDDGRWRERTGEDDGHRGGVGLRSMRERAELLGGTLVVGRSPEGTSVEVCIPLPKSPGDPGEESPA